MGSAFTDSRFLDLRTHWIVSWVDVVTDGLSAHPSWCRVPLWPMTRIFFSFFRRTIALLFVSGRPLWRENGSVICSAICQWSESRRTHNQTLLSDLRLLGSLSVASYDSQVLRWKYSNPPPKGGQWIDGWVGPRDGLDGANKKFFTLSDFEFQPFGRPASSQSHLLRYPGTYNLK
jgi:hypothetical protein